MRNLCSIRSSFLWKLISRRYQDAEISSFRCKFRIPDALIYFNSIFNARLSPLAYRRRIRITSTRSKRLPQPNSYFYSRGQYMVDRSNREGEEKEERERGYKRG